MRKLFALVALLFASPAFATDPQFGAIRIEAAQNITHAFVSTKTQGADSSKVSRDEWNAAHVAPAVLIASVPTGFVWPAQPAAVTEFCGASTGFRWRANLTSYSTIRLTAQVIGAGAATAALRLQYTTTLDGSGGWDYLDSVSGPSVSINATGVTVSATVSIATAAKADVLLRLVGINGDGAGGAACYSGIRAATATLADTATTTTGNAGTATALAANGANCAAGTFPLGVDVSGAAESCTALPTTITGTANQIAASAATGAITLSIPTNPTLPGTTTGTFSGALTGNASTATALAANGANCSAGSYALGVDAGGAAENCTADSVKSGAAASTCTINSAVYIDASGNLQCGGAPAPVYDATNIRLQVGTGSGTQSGLYLGYSGISGFGAIWSTALTPSTSNYGLRLDGASGATMLNGASSLSLAIATVGKATIGGTAGSGFNITAGTATTDVRALSTTQTWNAAGVTFTGHKYTVTDTASAAGSLHSAWYGGAAGTTVEMQLTKNGALQVGDGSVSAPSYSFASETGSGFYRVGSGNFGFAVGGTREWVLTSSVTGFDSAMTLGWYAPAFASFDTYFTRLTAGVIGINGATTAPGWIGNNAGEVALSADYTNATASFTSTALSVTVISGRTYNFTLNLTFADSTAADGAQFDFNGGSAAATNFRVHCMSTNAAGAILAQSNAASTALATANSVTLALTTQANLVCNGTFVPSGNGTFIVRAAQAAHSTGTLTVHRGSWLSVKDARPL